MKLEEIIEEQNEGILKTTKNKPLVDAIVNRHPITFYYSGPRKPKKKSVKAGYRVKAEPVALGAHKSTGNLLVRAYIDDPSTSKRGTPGKVGKEKSNYGWRTFLAARMSNVQVVKDETFNTIREKYNGGGDDKSMSVTYVSTDFSKTPPKPRIGDIKKPSKTPSIEPEKPKPATITKQARNVDAELKKFDVELDTIEKDIKTNLDGYKANKGKPEEVKFIQQLKDLNKKKDELLNKIADTIENIGKDVKPEDKSKISNFTRRVSAKKKDPETLIPTPTEKPSKKPNQKDQEPENKEKKLPEIPKKQKPTNEPEDNRYDLNEEFVNRVKKLITYF
jgi:hypothetical protein